jgi:RHS repeat-associated protein
MNMPGRKFSVGSEYRYGFNGKENDNDITKGGQDYGMRIYDTRLGRFLSVDPLSDSYPWNSTYSFSEGNPINYIDLDGAETPTRTAQATRTATVPKITVTIDPNLLNGKSGGSIITPKGQMFTNGPISSAAYAAPSVRMVTQDELNALIPGNAMAASINPDGVSMTVTGVNGSSWQVSLIHRDPAVMIKTGITWVDRIGTRLQVESQAIFNYSQWNVSIQAFEIITTNPGTLSDEYLDGVRKRLLNGTSTANDRMCANEVSLRQKAGKILPNYENPGHHDPLATNFNRTKSILPLNHAEMFEQSQLGADGNRWTKVGKGKKAVYHRFQDDGNGNWHWNGSTDSKLNDGTPNAIQQQNVPVGIKRLNND